MREHSADAHPGLGVQASGLDYRYDELDRVTSHQEAQATRSYAYDANGNRTQKTVGGNTYGFRYPNHPGAKPNNRLVEHDSSTGLRSFLYDAAGNATRVGSLTPIVHDDRGRMVSVTSSAGTTTYAYNGLGERVRKTGPVSAIPTGTHHFVYAEDGKLLGEYDANGAVILEHVYAEDVPVFVMRGAKTFHVHTDHLNTPREIYDMAWDGTVVVSNLDSVPPKYVHLICTYSAAVLRRGSRHERRERHRTEAEPAGVPGAGAQGGAHSRHFAGGSHRRDLAARRPHG